MFIANEAPLEKSTPEACRMAFPLKLRAPDGSLAASVSRCTVRWTTARTRSSKNWQKVCPRWRGSVCGAGRGRAGVLRRVLRPSDLLEGCCLGRESDLCR